MTVLVVGASGATGRQLVHQLLLYENKVKVIVRSKENVPKSWDKDKNLDMITASLLELNEKELIEYTADCDAIASCLGHNMTFKGIYGQPRKLVSEATKRLCDAVIFNKPKNRVKFVLMNSSGVKNSDLNEPISLSQKIIVGLLRLL